MAVFSRRNGYNQEAMQLECASDTLKQRIMGTFLRKEYVVDDAFGLKLTYRTTGVEDMMIEMGVSYKPPQNDIIKQKNADMLQSCVVHSGKWYTIYDFIERYLSISKPETVNNMTTQFNRILEDEVSAYRILDGLVVPITNQMELEAIHEAMSSPYDSVNTHIQKALSCYADRQAPDYENSIKESISAVEAMCCIITGLNGANATLGKALKKLKEKGLRIHPAMENAFSSLYGYTSDENGIRHGGIDFVNAPPEDAKYMLVSCSAFVNYLMEKWAKVK